MLRVGPVAISFLTSLTPLVEILDIIKYNKSVCESSCINYASMWLYYSLWAIYGIFKGDIYPVGITNIWGLLASTYYCYVLIMHAEAQNKKRIMILYSFTVLFSIITLHYCIFKIHSNEVIEARVGFLASFMSILLMASPLSSVLIVLEKGTESLSFPLSIMYNITATFWCFYGIIIQDNYIAFTNLIGGGLYLIELALFAFLPPTYNNDKNSISLKSFSLVL
eukprot:gene11046-23096_t